MGYMPHYSTISSAQAELSAVAILEKAKEEGDPPAREIPVREGSSFATDLCSCLKSFAVVWYVRFGPQPIFGPNNGCWTL